jgi:hypothetical protein
VPYFVTVLCRKKRLFFWNFCRPAATAYDDFRYHAFGRPGPVRAKLVHHLLGAIRSSLGAAGAIGHKKVLMVRGLQ